MPVAPGIVWKRAGSQINNNDYSLCLVTQTIGINSLIQRQVRRHNILHAAPKKCCNLIRGRYNQFQYMHFWNKVY